jgi:hypothetical protein
MDKNNIVKALAGYLPSTFHEESEISICIVSYLSQDDINGVNGVNPLRTKSIMSLYFLNDLQMGKIHKPLLELKPLKWIKGEELEVILKIVFEDFGVNFKVISSKDSDYYAVGIVNIDGISTECSVEFEDEEFKFYTNNQLEYVDPYKWVVIDEYLRYRNFDVKQPSLGNLTLKTLGLAKY